MRVRVRREADELLDRDARLSNELAQGALREFSVVMDRQATKRWPRIPENDVASLLAIKLIPKPTKRRDSLPS
jgi:hypothetical protein